MIHGNVQPACKLCLGPHTKHEKKRTIAPARARMHTHHKHVTEIRPKQNPITINGNFNYFIRSFIFTSYSIVLYGKCVPIMIQQQQSILLKPWRLARAAPHDDDNQT